MKSKAGGLERSMKWMNIERGSPRKKGENVQVISMQDAGVMAADPTDLESMTKVAREHRYAAVLIMDEVD